MNGLEVAHGRVPAALATLGVDCPVVRLRVDGAYAGLRAVCPSTPARAGDAKAVRVLTLLAPEGGVPSASVVTVCADGFDPRSEPPGVGGNGGERRSVLQVMRELGVLPPSRIHSQWEVGLASHLRKSGVVTDLADSLAAARDYMRPHVAFAASLFDMEALGACERIERSLEGYDVANWLDDSLWPMMDSRHGRQAPLLRALWALPQHADLMVAAALRHPVSLLQDDPARLLCSVVAAVRGEGREIRRALASKVVRAGPTLLELSSAEAARQFEDLWELPALSQWQGGPPQTRATATLLRLGMLPSSWVPDADAAEEWGDCMGVLQTVYFVLGGMGSGIPYEEAVGRRGGWGPMRARLHGLLGDRRLGAFRAAREMVDVIEAFMRQVVRPAVSIARGEDAPSGVPYERVRSILFGRSTVERALERSNEWHARQAGIDHALATLTPEVSTLAKWGKGFPDAAFGDIEIVVLDDGLALSDEGRKGPNPDGTPGLAHCVGGYADKCATGRSRILSIRRMLSNGGRERLSTVELVEGNEAGQPRVVQHSSRRNGDPCPAAVAALDAYLEGLASGALPVDQAALRPVRCSASAIVSAGYDFNVPGTFEGAMAAWRIVLPRAIRDWTPADFVAAAFQADAGPDDSARPGP